MIPKLPAFYRAHFGEPRPDCFPEVFPCLSEKASCFTTAVQGSRLHRRCKTGELDFSASYCPECGHLELYARSYNNWDCFCFQSPLEKKWVMEGKSELIQGVAYYHIIFTVPYELNNLIYVNQKLLYGLLFLVPLIPWSLYAGKNSTWGLLAALFLFFTHGDSS